MSCDLRACSAFNSRVQDAAAQGGGEDQMNLSILLTRLLGGEFRGGFPLSPPAMPAFDETTSRRRRGSNKDALVVGGVAGGLSGGDVLQQQQRRNTDHRATSFQRQSPQYSHRVSLQQQQY